MKDISKTKMAMTGIISGLINGLLGSAGGVIAVICLEKFGCDKKMSHAQSLGIMLPVSVVSLIFYCLKGIYPDTDILYKILFTGIIGAVMGSIYFKNIKTTSLKKIFALLLIFAGIRGLVK